jgi:hypothetical protein
MREAITAAMNGKGSREELQAAAREMVRELRRGEQAPERVLLQIKSVLADAGLRPNYSEGDEAAGREGALYRDVIAWSIKAYYDDRGDRGDAPGQGATS